MRTLTLTAVTRSDFSVIHTKLTSADPATVDDLWLEAGDIFVERSNTRELVGLAALYEGPERFAIFPDLMIRVRPDLARLLPAFVAEYLLTEDMRSHFRRNASGTAGNMPKIDQRILSETPVPVPSLEEQAEIVGALGAVDRKSKVEEARRAALDSLFTSLLGGLMTARRRVDHLAAEFA